MNTDDIDESNMPEDIAQNENQQQKDMVQNRSQQKDMAQNKSQQKDMVQKEAESTESICIISNIKNHFTDIDFYQHTVVCQPSNGSLRKKQGPEQYITLRQFYKYRMAFKKSDYLKPCRDCKKKIDAQEARPENCAECAKNPLAKDKVFHWLWVWRKLAEFFTITILNRIEQADMQTVRLTQTNLRKIKAKDYIDALEKNLPAGKKLGAVYEMPAVFAGSKLFYQKSYADLMTIVRRIGDPTWFFNLGDSNNIEY